MANGASPFNREIETFFNYKITTADNNETVVMYRNEKKFNSDKADAEKLGSTVEILKEQTFAVTTHKSINGETDGILALIPNEEAALDATQYGVSVKQTNKRRAIMLNEDTAQREGIWDLIAEIQEPPAEGRMSAAERAQNAQRERVKQQYREMHPGAPIPSNEDIDRILQMSIEQSIAMFMSQQASTIAG